jgi:ABC-type branched-subunit amino acid transport system ATPase component
MKLNRLKYSNGELKIDPVSFEDINLIVGANAAGKTRLLNIIANFAKHLSGKTDAALTGCISTEFEDGENRFAYRLEAENALIVSEANDINGFDYIFLIVNVGTDERVASAVADNSSNMIAKGFGKIIGLRDLYPNKREDEPRLRSLADRNCPG